MRRSIWNVNIPRASLPHPLHSPRAFELFKTGLFKFPLFPTPLAQVIVKCPGFTRRDKFRVDRRIIVIWIVRDILSTFSSVKNDDKIFFLQEVEIHRNEVKLLEGNNAKLEAEIRWMLCQFVFEILLSAVWSPHPPFSIFREFFRKIRYLWCQKIKLPIV